MLWEKLTEKKHIFLVFVFVVLYLLTRLLFLGPDVINSDAVNWHFRSQQFTWGLKTGDFKKTHQHYHPGVTLMWISGIPIELLKQISPTDQHYNHLNFEAFHFVAKYSVVFTQLILTLILLYVLNLKFSFVKSLLVVSLFSFEPWIVGNSRLYHLDPLMTLFLFTGLLLAYYNLKDFSWWKGVFSGVFLSLAMLTKSVAAGAALFVAGMAFVYFFLNGTLPLKEKFSRFVRYSFSIGISYLATMFLVFPALWVEPYRTLYDIFYQSRRIGVRTGHGEVLFGVSSMDPGFWFYPVVFFLRTSPLSLIGLILYLVHRKIKIRFDLATFLGIFYLGYFVLLFWAAKKIDRYIVPVYPFIALLGVTGYYKLSEYFDKFLIRVLIIMLAGFSIFYPLVSYYPYYYVYSTPLAGSTQNANRILEHKQFGVGIPLLRDTILSSYGDYPNVGMSSPKSLQTVYKSSSLFDTREYSPSKYDILVLQLNKGFPSKVVEGDYEFRFDQSVYINGLEYWRIYVKE